MKNRWILVIKLYFDKYSIVWTCSNFWKMWSSLNCRDWVLFSQLPCLLTKFLSSWGVEITGQKKFVRYSLPLFLFWAGCFVSWRSCTFQGSFYASLWRMVVCSGELETSEFIPLINIWNLRFSEDIVIVHWLLWPWPERENSYLQRLIHLALFSVNLITVIVNQAREPWCRIQEISWLAFPLLCLHFFLVAVALGLCFI